tara:strand:+ start:237 stop:698 length:462 start_codon:yes stop_codon:yes gene_type:complete
MGKYKDKNGTTKVGDFLRGVKNVAPDILNLAGNITGIEVLGVLGDKIKGSDTLTPIEKETALKLLEIDKAEMEEVTKRWQADLNSDNSLSKNVRPLVMMFLTISMAFFIIIDSSFKDFKVREDWISLLSSLLLLVYGAYFGGRSLEKIQKLRK